MLPTYMYLKPSNIIIYQVCDMLVGELVWLDEQKVTLLESTFDALDKNRKNVQQTFVSEKP